MTSEDAIRRPSTLTRQLAAISSDSWVLLSAGTQEAFRQLAVNHGLEALRMGFPVTVEEWDGFLVMKFRYYELDENGHKFLTAPGQVAAQERVMLLNRELVPERLAWVLENWCPSGWPGC